MEWYLVKQPNGLLARFSENVDHFTHFGMTEEEALWMCASEYKMRAEASKEAVEGALQDYPTGTNRSKKPGDGLSRWRKALSWIEESHGREARQDFEEEAKAARSATSVFPVDAAKDFTESYFMRQVIICAWDGKATHVVTYGGTDHDSDQAAEGGNRVKKALGWPESLQAESPKVTALRAENERLSQRNQALEMLLAGAIKVDQATSEVIDGETVRSFSKAAQDALDEMFVVLKDL